MEKLVERRPQGWAPQPWLPTCQTLWARHRDVHQPRARRTPWHGVPTLCASQAPAQAPSHEGPPVWPPRLHVRAKGKTQGGLAEGKVILQFAFKAVVRIVCVYNVSVCTCVYVRALPTCVYTCVHVSVCMGVCTRVGMCPCMHVYVCHVCTCVRVYCIYVCTSVYMSICVRVCTPGCACVPVCTCISMCEHVCMCVCTCVSVCLRKNHRLYSGHQESMDRMLRMINPCVGLFPAPECSFPKRCLISQGATSSYLKQKQENPDTGVFLGKKKQPIPSTGAQASR